MTSVIAKELGVEQSTVSRWRGRFAREGISEDVLEDLSDAPRSGRPPTISPATRMQVVATACDPLPDGDGMSGWTLDLLVEELPSRGIEGVSRSSVQRILVQNDVKPHRFEMWLHSPDPRFVEKVDEIVPLYLRCPPRSVVLSYDEKTGMQAVERKHPDRQPRPGRLARHEFEYIRHGTQSLLATLNVHTGEVLADCGPTRTGNDMEQHMERVAAHYPDVEVHVVLDNLNIHCGERWKQFNERHGNRFHFHYTPLHASWVNQVEIWFARLEREVIARGIFTSVQDLSRKLMRYIRSYSKTARPFKWKYSDVRRRILPC